MRCEKCGAYAVMAQSGDCLNCIVKSQPRIAKLKKVAEKRHRKQMKIGITDSDWADIPAGAFMMGSPESEEGRCDNERYHHVEVAAFKMLKTPVTFAMYDAFCSNTGKDKPEDEDWGRVNRPVIRVNYWGAVDYCAWLSKESDWSVRLPTEAEWEYACRAGTTTPFWTGETISTDQANYDGNFTYGDGSKGIYRRKTTPVDMFQPNPWGLHDMHGNGLEWCASEFDEGYGGMELRDASGDRNNDSDRALRSGPWIQAPKRLRSAKRFAIRPDYSLSAVVFRLVQD